MFLFEAIIVVQIFLYQSFIHCIGVSAKHHISSKQASISQMEKDLNRRTEEVRERDKEVCKNFALCFKKFAHIVAQRPQQKNGSQDENNVNCGNTDEIKKSPSQLKLQLLQLRSFLSQIKMNSINWCAIYVWVLAQLVKHCNTKTETRCSKPVEALRNCLNYYNYNCNGHISISE